MHTLALARLAQGRGQEALALAHEVLDLRRRAYGEMHNNVANSYEFIASIHNQLRQPASAETLLVRALLVLEQVTGPNHRDIARVKRLLAETREELQAPR